MKLGIGTVQFGLDYGIGNSRGKTPAAEVSKILDIAAAQDIRILDTSPAYGESEQTLGQALRGSRRFDIVTKTPVYRGKADRDTVAAQTREAFELSLRSLGCSSVYGLLIHDADDLLADYGQDLFATLESIKREGLARKIGVSVYTAAQLDRILESYPIDLIQAPVNIFDQRLVSSGRLQRLKKTGVEIHARSVFLQGLLLMDPVMLPAHFDSVREHLFRIHRDLADLGLTPLEAALAFVLAIPEIDIVLCGIVDSQQLLEICAAAHRNIDVAGLSGYALTDPDILDPSRWPA